MMREIEALVREKGKWVRYQLLRSMLSRQKCEKLRGINKNDIRRTKGVHMVVLIIKEKANRFYKYIKGKGVTGE